MSSDTTVASVSNDGTVKALKAGSTVITIKSSNNIQAQIAVIVSEEEPTKPKSGCGSVIESLPIIAISFVSLALVFSVLKIKKTKERA